MEGASQGAEAIPSKAMRVTDTTSATDNRPGTACLSALDYRRIDRRAMAGIKDFRWIVFSALPTKVRLIRKSHKKNVSTIFADT
jgi:hypothetical protein